jgi:hypothetical protein
LRLHHAGDADRTVLEQLASGIDGNELVLPGTGGAIYILEACVERK